MAPMKRTRAGEETVELLESASSNFRRDNQKRQRLSTRDRSEDAVEEHENELDLLMGAENAQHTATQRQYGGNRENYERERDHVSEDEDDEERVEQITEDIRRQKSHQQQNQAADAGVIESVTCINFMCHKKLHIVLGPLINFIIGHNGSGKSAILTALTLCLGGKATATNRGQSLKSFVREGEETACLIVKVKNKGDQSYRQDVYGESIIVERHFSIHGSSSFKIKNVNGKLVSTKRHELDEITDFYALQLENPVNVLTQDMARQFLNSSTEADKYRFFIKGVQLEQLDNDYLLLSESLDNADALMVNVTDDLANLEKQFDDALHKFQLSQRQTSLRSKIQKLSRKMAWAQVEEQEDRLAQLERQIEQTQTQIERRRENAKTVEDRFGEAVKALEEAQATHQELTASMEPVIEQQKEAKEAFEDNKKEIMDLQASQRQVKQDYDREEARAEKIRRDIEEEKHRLEAADGGAHASKLAEIEEAEAVVPQAKAAYEQHQTTLPALVRSATAASRKVEDIKEAVDKKRREVEDADARLRQLREQIPQPYAAYHPSVRRVISAMNAESRFHQKPIGPMGEYIKLLKPEWSSILEKYFGNALSAFVVTSKHDQQLLSGIIEKAGYFGSIIIGNEGYMDTSAQQPDPKFDTIMNSLEINNDLVRNQLIMAQSIEQVALIQDRNEAYHVMFQDGGSHNVKVCLSFHEHARGVGIRFTRGVGGGQKSDPIAAWTGIPRMQTDTETQIGQRRDILHGLKQELNELEGQRRAFEAEWKGCQQAVNRHANQSKGLREAEQRAEDRVVELKEEFEAATPLDGRLDGLKAQLASVEDMLNHSQRQYNESVAEKGRLDEDARRFKSTLDAADAQVGDIKRQIDKGQLNISKLTGKRRQILEAKNSALGDIDDAVTEKEGLEKIREELVAHVESFKEQASTVGERCAIERGETPRSLDAQLGRLNEQIRNFEREIGGNAEQISRTMYERKEARDTAIKQFENLEALGDALRLTLKNRHERWYQFRSNISRRARAGFMHLLSERDFKGRMLIDHRNRLLQLLVQPDSSRRGDEGRQTRTLSGGEKSFSTICLLLALWDAMGSPIRCLDEFDVFMDSVNRDVSMRMMIQAARGSVGRQFILITPQAMGNVSMGDDVKVIRLNDPERGQTTLPFAQS